MNIVTFLVDFILHIDEHLTTLVANYGIWVYLVLFLILFAETGLVFTPFLPGDSLLFAVGALAAIGGMNLWIAVPLLLVAAILGDSSNYLIGSKFGRLIIANERAFFIKAEHVEKTEEFYARYGAQAIILARFMPIVRTFAPFIAGVGTMKYSTFFRNNVIGGVAWVLLFIFLGFFFGQVQVVKDHFETVILAIIFISVLPGVYAYVREKLSSRKPKGIEEDVVEEDELV